MSFTHGHVFVVDDNPDMLFYLRELLELMGYTVDTFSSPAAFLRESAEISPAVLVLDMRMPQASGLDLQKSLEKLGRKLPIIFISGESDKDEIIAAFSMGAIAFLWKPFGRNELKAAIDKGLAQDQRRSLEDSRLDQVKRFFSTLTPREQELFFLFIDGFTNKAIAEQKNINAVTVKKHRSTVYEKFRVTKTSELIQMCKGLDILGL
jgi:FixJ family two-component response regulator